MIHYRMLLLLLTCAFGGLYAQQIEERIEAEPLSSVLDRYAAAYDLKLAYETETVATQMISVEVAASSPVAALYQVLDAADLDYHTIDANKVLIRPAMATAPVFGGTLKVQGRVLAADSGEKLAYATIFEARTGLGAVTDKNGRFALVVPDSLSQIALGVSYLGYNKKERVVNLAETAAVDIYLQPSPHEISTIVVSDDWTLPTLNPEGHSLSIQPDDMLPGLNGGADALRTIQLLPGVSAVNDRSAGLKIRGAAPEESLMIWDAMTLIRIDHLFGPFSSLNNGMVSFLELHKNYTPIEYGGKTGSVLEIHSPNEMDKPSSELTLGSLVAEGDAQIRLSPKSFIHLGTRSTVNKLFGQDPFRVLEQSEKRSQPNAENGLLSNNQEIQVRPAFQFFDGNLKWVTDISDKDQLIVSAFNSTDHYEYDLQYEFRTRPFLLVLENEVNFSEQSSWENSAYGLSWTRKTANRQQAYLFGYSRYQKDGMLSTALTRTGAVTQSSASAVNSRTNEVDHAHATWHNTLTNDKGQRTQYGLRAEWDQVNLAIQNDTSTVLANDARAYQLSGFGSKAWAYGRWTWEAGAHLTYYSGTEQPYLSPRLSAAYELGVAWRLKTAAQHQQQFLRTFYHENRFGRSLQVWTLADDRQRPPAQSTQWMLGATWQSEGWLLDVEGYYKHLDGVLDHASLQTGFPGGIQLPRGGNQFRLFAGEGRVLGLDVMLRYTHKQYQSWLSYTLSSATKKVAPLFEGERYPANDDRRHQVNWVQQLQFGKWTLSGIYVGASGTPYLPRPDEESDRGRLQVSQFERLPAYHRLDVALRYDFKWKSTQAFLSASIINLTNRQNIYYRQQIFSFETGTRRAVLSNELQLLDRSWSIAAGLAF